MTPAAGRKVPRKASSGAADKAGPRSAPTAASRSASGKPAKGPNADPAAVVTRLYEAFQRRDGTAMADCYASEATFSDPVFPDLQGEDVGRMWQMLCAGAKDLLVTFRDVSAAEDAAQAHWEARYTFSVTGRRVHNVIQASFVVEAGRIVHHVDSFSFWRWSRQALGPAGWLLGWTPLVKAKVRRQAAARLAMWKSKRPA